VDGLGSLVDRDLRFVNRSTDSGLRRELDDALVDLAAERSADRSDLADRIDGYGLTVRAFESPARKVLSGDADVGLGLRETAERLGCGFVSLGEQSVVVRASPERADRRAVTEVADALADAAALDGLLAGLAGYSRNSRNDP